MLQDWVSSSPSDAAPWSGVTHLEFSVLHRSVDAVSDDAGLSGVTPSEKGRWAVGDWRLAIGGWWRLMAVGSGWRLAVGGGWWLVAVCGWRLMVPWGGP